MTTEIRWLWLKYKLCRVKSFRVIVSMVKDHGQYIHIYVSPRGKSPVIKLEWYTRLNCYSCGWTNLLFFLVPEYSLVMISIHELLRY